MFIIIKKLMTSSTCYENLSWSRNETLEAESDQRSMGPGKELPALTASGCGAGTPGGPSGGPAALWAAVCLISAGTESR